MKIIVFGASGSGTTTLAKSLADHFNWPHLDADDYYWAQTTIPFTVKVPLETRNARLKQDVVTHPNVVVSGSLVTWSPYWNQAFDLGVFLKIPPEIRMDRLKKREIERYGQLLQESEDQQKKTQEFLDWAAQYDDPTFEGRSITQHRRWIQALTCEVLELDGDFTNPVRMQQVVDRIAQLDHK